MSAITWSKAAYDATATSDCWWYTPYDKGPDPGYWDHVSQDDEMREIVAMELALDEVPDWARAVGIGYLPPCGHYTFPTPLLQVLDLIGAASQHAVDTTCKIQCYTADQARKAVAEDICRRLEIWLAGNVRQTDLDSMLGERTEKKMLLVERVLLAMRNAITTFRWHDDPGAPATAADRIQAVDDRLRDIDPQWGRLFKIDLGGWWLCAPNAFRLLEYDLWAIGHDRQAQSGDLVPKYLDSDATCPNREEAAAWWPQFLAALDGWWQARPVTGPVADDVHRRLGASTPTKRWLVRLYLHKLRMLASYEGEGLTKLIKPSRREVIR